MYQANCGKPTVQIRQADDFTVAVVLHVVLADPHWEHSDQMLSAPSTTDSIDTDTGASNTVPHYAPLWKKRGCRVRTARSALGKISSSGGHGTAQPHRLRAAASCTLVVGNRKRIPRQQPTKQRPRRSLAPRPEQLGLRTLLRSPAHATVGDMGGAREGEGSASGNAARQRSSRIGCALRHRAPTSTTAALSPLDPSYTFADRREGQ
ncbi:hypothetical protein C8R47DRAFT_1203830 [Mycena vitilis]|nr:hypothetical protein C8R47DRAFT_1203830 [Mycena vitilis]